MAVRGINKVILVGRLGKIRKSLHPNGGAVANLQVATSKRRDKRAGEMKGATEWHRVVLFGKLAEVAGEYLRKGRRSTLKASFAPVAGKITVLPVTSPKSLLKPRAPCRCWGVHHSRTLRCNRSLSRMVSHRVLTRRKGAKTKGRGRKAAQPEPQPQPPEGRITGFQTISRSDWPDCDNRPVLRGASPEI